MAEDVNEGSADWGREAGTRMPVPLPTPGGRGAGGEGERLQTVMVCPGIASHPSATTPTPRPAGSGRGGRTRTTCENLATRTGLAAALACLALLPSPIALAVQDPTRPPPGLSAPPPGMAQAVEAPLRVSGVFLAGRHSFAIVDEREVRIGDRLGEGWVTRIDETGVWLRVNGATRLLRLLPEIKKPPTKP